LALKEKGRVEIWGKIAYLKTEGGKEALIPLNDLCSVVERFEIELENYKC
jgi:hypothetical protein